MISGVSHISVLVTNQDQALDFYTNALGLELHTDAQFGEMRWLTVSPVGNRNFEIALMPIPQEKAELIKSLSSIAPLCVFTTPDCHATYSTLKSRGVVFLDEPQEEVWGISCNFRDPFGNVFHLNQIK